MGFIVRLTLGYVFIIFWTVSTDGASIGSPSRQILSANPGSPKNSTSLSLPPVDNDGQKVQENDQNASPDSMQNEGPQTVTNSSKPIANSNKIEETQVVASEGDSSEDRATGQAEALTRDRLKTDDGMFEEVSLVKNVGSLSNGNSSEENHLKPDGAIFDKDDEDSALDSISKISASDSERNITAEENLVDTSVHNADIEKDRNENSRSLDIKKYISPEFHSKNNVYNLPLSQETQSFLSYGNDEFQKDFTPENDASFTTSTNNFFDEFHKDPKDDYIQGLGYFDHDHFNETDQEPGESKTPEQSLDEFLDKPVNGSKTELEITRIKNMQTNNTKNKSGTYSSKVSEERTSVNYHMSFNDTEIVDEEESDEKDTSHDSKEDPDFSHIENSNTIKGGESSEREDTSEEDSSKEAEVDNSQNSTNKSLTFDLPPKTAILNKNESRPYVLTNSIIESKPKSSKKGIMPTYTSTSEEELTKEHVSPYLVSDTTKPIFITKRGKSNVTSDIKTSTTAPDNIERLFSNNETELENTLKLTGRNSSQFENENSLERDKDATNSDTSSSTVRSSTTSNINSIPITTKTKFSQKNNNSSEENDDLIIIDVITPTTESINNNDTGILKNNISLLRDGSSNDVENTTFRSVTTTVSTIKKPNNTASAILDSEHTPSIIFVEITATTTDKGEITTEPLSNRDINSTTESEEVFSTTISVETSTETTIDSIENDTEPSEIRDESFSKSSIDSTTIIDDINDDATTAIYEETVAPTVSSTSTIASTTLQQIHEDENPTTVNVEGKSSTESTSKRNKVESETESYEIPFISISEQNSSLSKEIHDNTTTEKSSEDNEGTTKYNKMIFDDNDLEETSSTVVPISLFDIETKTKSTSITEGNTDDERISRSDEESTRAPAPSSSSTIEILHIASVGNDQTTITPEIFRPDHSYPNPDLENINRNIEVTTETDDVEGTTIAENLEVGPSDGNGATIAAITISCIGAVCLLLLAGLLYMIKKRHKRFNYGQRCTPVSLDAYSVDNVSVYNSMRRKGVVRASKRSYGNPVFDDSICLSNPLNFNSLTKFAVNREAINAEFEDVPMVTAQMHELPDGCDTKNRYANVIPLPETRVNLTPIDGYPTSYYINANYVRGPKDVRGYYIATQAPMQNTVDDFWRMVWEQKSKLILMLTNLYENHVEKCTDYLPPSEVLDCHRLFGDFQVTLKKREVKEKYVISSLQLKNMVSNSWREVTHMWYLGWPEKGVPMEVNSIIAFLIEARSYVKLPTSSESDKMNEYNDITSPNGIGVSPVIVHCSPGTGRTGAVIACDMGIRDFELSRQVDIPKLVYKLRRDRAGSVQTKDQYAFIYKVVSTYAIKLTGGVSLDNL